MALKQAVVLALVLTALFLSAQIQVSGGSLGSCNGLSMTILSAQWTSLPRYPGAPAQLSLTFYSTCVYHVVTFSVVPQCPYVRPGEPTVVQTVPAGTAFAVPVQFYADRLNVTCPLEIVATAEYGPDYGSILGASSPYFLTLFIPPYPDFAASVNGTAYLGLPSEVVLKISDPYRYPAQISINGESAAVIAPARPFIVNKTADLSVVVVPYSQQAALIVDVESADYLGNPVSYSFTVPLSVAQPPPATLSVVPSTLYIGRANNVTIEISVPFRANGTAVVTLSGASSAESPLVVPIAGGVGIAHAQITPLQSPVVLQAVVYYSVMGFQQSAQISAEVNAIQPQTPLASLYIAPQMLVENSPNNLTIVIRADGPFNSSVTISGASAEVPMPIYISGVGYAAYSLVVYPTSSQVVVTATIQTRGGTQQYTAYLPASSSNALLVVPTPSLIPAGGNRTVYIKLINQGNIPVERGVLVVEPAAGSPALGKVGVFSFGELAPGEYLDVPLSFLAPATASGPLPFQYTIYYYTPAGSGVEQGSFFVQVYQRPSVQVLATSVVPQTPQAGSPLFISLTLVNNGYETVNNLEVAAVAPEGLTPMTPTLNYVGSLSPQQTQAVTFSFNATRPGVYNLSLVVAYQDQYGASYNLTVPLHIIVASSAVATTQQSGQPHGGAALAPISLVLVVVVAAALMAIGIWRRRR